MSWNCRLIECVPGLNGNNLKIGDMFYFSEEQHPLLEDQEDPYGWFRFFVKGDKLSDYYRANNAHRPPILVWWPGRTLFCVDSKCWNNGNYYGGWTVTGEAPFITVSPSINVGSSYHGFLQNGVLQDDCEGRLFGEDGRQTNR